MAKRIVTKIGNVFCVEIDNRYKSYFQYIGNDYTNLNSSVIRVFKSRYPIEYVPEFNKILNDEIAFHAHTVLRAGIQFGAWYKVGKANPVDPDICNNILWGLAQETVTLSAWECIEVNPLGNWEIWHTNQPFIKIGVLPKYLWDIVEYGAVISYIDILNRIKLGYYVYQSWEYDIIKRIPHSDVNSYTRREVDGKTIYQHFLGEYVVQEIIVFDDGETEIFEGNTLDRPKFWETNWKRKELITEEVFNTIWNMYD